MSKKGDLQGQTIVFTGQPKSDEAFLEVTRLGGEFISFPLIRTQEETFQDEQFINSLHTYDWLIFTSQNAVVAFEQKVLRHKILVDSLPCKIAAVGSKTATALERIGFHVTFTPTTFSADAFVQQFPLVAGYSDTCLFLRGSLAKATIKEGISQSVDEWTVYETLPDEGNAKSLGDYLTQHPHVFVAFASPSSVEVFTREIAPKIGWNDMTIAAIGHVTATALKKQGVAVHIQPTTYTWLALIQEIAKWKDDSYK